MRIALVISTLGAGGAQRVMSILANYWARHGREVVLITMSPEGNDWYKLHPGVQRVGLNLLGSSRHTGQALQNNLQRLKNLRIVLKKFKPHVVLSFVEETNVLTLIASLGLNIPLIVSERIDPRQHPVGFAWNMLRSVLYRHADALVMQSHALREWGVKLVGEKAVHVIPNPVNPVLNGDAQGSKESSCRTVVAMGRLARQKGFDILVHAFSQCVESHPDWSLVILGEGEERGSLETLVGKLGLKDRIGLPGLVQDPTRFLQGADLFVMSSRFEGFPNALLEAMACGLAVISTDCPSGPREIIRSGVDGVLVPCDAESLASAMHHLMEDHAERQRLGANAREGIERFGIEKIMKMWDVLFAEICGERVTGTRT